MDILATGMGIALLASLLINFALLIRHLQRPPRHLLIPGEDETYLLKDRKTGHIGLMPPGLKVKEGDPRIVTFARRNRLSFPVYNRVLKQLSERELTNERGGISLRIHTTTPAPFPVITNDGHFVYVTASVSFAVERERAATLAKLADFGAQLERRIHSAFSSAIGALRDEEMRMSLGKIEAQVTDELEQMEKHERFGVPLGIKIYEARFQYEDADGRAGQNITVMDSSAGAETAAPPAKADGQEAALPKPAAQVVTLQASPAASTASGRPGAMQFAGTELDKLLDQFKGRSPEQIAALMQLMELQTRQNIVSMLAESRGVIVFSAKELGLDGNPVVEEAVANALSAGMAPAKAAE